MMNFLKMKMSPAYNDFLGYIVNPKHAWLIGTILLFATKKAKQQRMDSNGKLIKLDLNPFSASCNQEGQTAHGE